MSHVRRCRQRFPPPPIDSSFSVVLAEMKRQRKLELDRSLDAGRMLEREQESFAQEGGLACT